MPILFMNLQTLNSLYLIYLTYGDIANEPLAQRLISILTFKKDCEG